MLQQKAKALLENLRGNLRENLKKRVISVFMAIHSSQPSDIGSHFYVRHTLPNGGNDALRPKSAHQDTSASRRDANASHQDSSGRQTASEQIVSEHIQDSGQSKRRKPLTIDQWVGRKPEKIILNAQSSSGKVVTSNPLTFQQQKALKVYSDNQASSYLLDQEIEVVHRFDRYA